MVHNMCSLSVPHQVSLHQLSALSCNCVMCTTVDECSEVYDQDDSECECLGFQCLMCRKEDQFIYCVGNIS